MTKVFYASSVGYKAHNYFYIHMNFHSNLLLSLKERNLYFFKFIFSLHLWFFVIVTWDIETHFYQKILLNCKHTFSLSLFSNHFFEILSDSIVIFNFFWSFTSNNHNCPYHKMLIIKVSWKRFTNWNKISDLK